VRSTQENFTKNLLRQNTKIDGLKVDTHIVVNDVKKDFSERIQDMDEFYQGSLKEINKTIENIRSMAHDSVNEKEKELTNMISNSVYKMKT
jgi:hypothetical protein